MKKIMLNDKFNLTRAVLDRGKTQTRRIVHFGEVDDAYAKKDLFPISNNRVEPYLIEKYSKYKVGEIVAVAQNYKEVDRQHRIGKNEAYKQRLDEMLPQMKKLAGWSNKLFVKSELMPHQICITNIRLQRLQDISDEDCLAEGIENLPYGGGFKPYAFYDKSIKVKSEKEGISYGWYRDFNTPREAYAALIDKVGKKGGWESNPWVFVYDFELVK